MAYDWCDFSWQHTIPQISCQMVLLDTLNSGLTYGMVLHKYWEEMHVAYHCPGYGSLRNKISVFLHTASNLPIHCIQKFDHCCHYPRRQFLMSLMQDACSNLLTNRCHDSTLINASQFYVHSNSRKRPNHHRWIAESLMFLPASVI